MADPAGDRLRQALLRRRLSLESEVGRGGMAVVYRARDLRHDRTLTVKVLRPDVAGGAERLVREGFTPGTKERWNYRSAR